MRVIYGQYMQEILVSDCDYPRLIDHRWTVVRRGNAADKFYAQSRIGGVLVYMHRFITNCPEGKLVDHINGNGLHNFRDNLRITCYGGNNKNAVGYGMIRFRGVSREGNRYRARIVVGDKRLSLGCYGSAEEAAKVYDEAALKYFGEFAYLNFPLIRKDYTPEVPF